MGPRRAAMNGACIANDRSNRRGWQQLVKLPRRGFAQTNRPSLSGKTGRGATASHAPHSTPTHRIQPSTSPETNTWRRASASPLRKRAQSPGTALPTVVTTRPVPLEHTVRLRQNRPSGHAVAVTGCAVLWQRGLGVPGRLTRRRTAP